MDLILLFTYCNQLSRIMKVNRKDLKQRLYDSDFILRINRDGRYFKGMKILLILLLCLSISMYGISLLY